MRATFRAIVGAFLALTGELTLPALAQKSELSTDGISATILGSAKFCEIAGHYKVPVELLAGVVVAEKLLNRRFHDSVQDGIVRVLLESRGSSWWEQWAGEAAALSQLAERERLQSNKWPVDVVLSGFVFSIGPAQITPRTALRACAREAVSPACSGGVRDVIGRLLDPDGSLELAAIVLRQERAEHLEITGIDVVSDLAMWATLYNVGGDYLRASGTDNRAPSILGRWVGERRDILRRELLCATSASSN